MVNFVTAFLQARSADGCTEKTIIWHRSCLGRFAMWAESQGLSDPDTLTVQDVRAYIVNLQEEGQLSPTSVATYVRSLRAFLRWLHEEELIDHDLTAKIKQVKSPKLDKQPFSTADLNKLFAAAESPRDKAILALLLDCGLRANELCQLKKSDVQFESRMLTVFGKGQKARNVPFSSKTATILRKALVRNDSDYVIPSRSNEALTPNGLLQVSYRLGKKAGVEGVHPHRFRHTFALTYLENGGDALSLQRILGHSSMDVTTGYVLMAANSLGNLHDAASPMANLNRTKRSR